MTGIQLVIIAAFVGCNSQKVEPADAAADAPAVEEEVEAAASSAMVIPERGDDSSRKSKNGQLSHSIGGVMVDVRFGRPEIRERQVWGGLVTYGEVWRTGADEAATFAIDKDVMVEGQPLPKGVYALFTIPGEEEWTVIFNKQAKQWGSFKYDEAQDALRVTVKPTVAEAMEAFDVEGTDSGIALRWAEVAVPVAITVPEADAAGAAPAEDGAEAPAEGEAPTAEAGEE